MPSDFNAGGPMRMSLLLALSPTLRGNPDISTKFRIKFGTKIAPKAWLPTMDLNHDKQIQSLLCYRYTSRQDRSHCTILGSGVNYA